MNYPFTKMHSLGNDFVMLNGVEQDIMVDEGIAKKIADRHFGIGCDQILLAQKPRAEEDFFLRIFNSDGSEAGQCGNGVRCFAKFLYDQGLTDKNPIRVATPTTRVDLLSNPDGTVTASMGQPITSPTEIPLATTEQSLQYALEVAGQPLVFHALSMGNPHCVVCVDSVDSAPVEQLGGAIENHSFFPQRTNVGFMEIVSPTQIKLRVHERGAGETLGCGSGSCAAVVSGIMQGLLSRRVQVSLPGGQVIVEWQSNDAEVQLTGDVYNVFEGIISIA